jgi:hypothetical protein
MNIWIWLAVILAASAIVFAIFRPGSTWLKPWLNAHMPECFAGFALLIVVVEAITGHHDVFMYVIAGAFAIDAVALWFRRRHGKGWSRT